MSWQDHISINPAVLTGKPVIKGTRLSVEFIMELISKSWSFDEIMKSYPPLTKEDIRAALDYATEMLKAEAIFSVSTGTAG